MAVCICGEEFEPRQGTGGKQQEYCSERCANRARKQRNRDKENSNRDNLVALPPRTNAPQEKIGVTLKYPGAKWVLAQWIIAQFPEHTTYIEPYFGSGAVFFTKEPAKYEIINDIDEQVVNLFRVIRSQGDELACQIEMTPWSRKEYYESYNLNGQPLEDARRFLVRCWQAHGVKTSDKTGWMNIGPKVNGSTTSRWNKLPGRILAAIERLKNTEIECIPALELIQRFQDASNCLLYVDPPYILTTRSGRMYKHEMHNPEHIALLDALDKHAGPVVLSGYAHPLYDERLAHWQRITTHATAEKGQTRTEVLWLNPKARRQTAPGLFDEIDFAG
jgi:DNA adenine methylase